MQCPNCGSPFEREARFARLAVCSSCQSAVVLDADSLRVAGTMATLVESDGPLYLGATGQIRALDGTREAFRVEGRVRYRYEQGFWDEWYLDGAKGTFWIGEDGGDFTVSRLSERKVRPGFLEKATPGSHLTLGARSYQVGERGVAVCEGGEGMLPFEIVSSEEVPFVDLEGAGGAVATIEIDADRARIYVGWRVDPAVIEVDVPKEPSPSAKQAVAVSCFRCAAPLTEDLQQTGAVICEYCGAWNDLAHDRVTCPSCATAFELLAGDRVEMAVCPSCANQIDLRGATPALLGHLVRENRPSLPFQLGQKGRLRGSPWVITGHIRFESRDEWGTYFSDELLLHNEDEGYRWLILEDSHFSLAQEAHGPGPDIPSGLKSRFKFDGRIFRTFEWRQTQKVVWVDGQLPYVAKVGEEIEYSDAVCPPFMLSQERTERESEYFLAEYVPASEVSQGFGIEDLSVHQHTVAPNQPYAISPLRASLKRVMGIAALVNLLIVLWAFSGTVTREFSAEARSPSGDEFLSEPFELDDAGTVHSLEFSAPVNNSWIYVEAALLNESNEVVAEFGAPIEYYYGVDGGESWSEGSTRYTDYFVIDRPGAYRLLTRAEAPPGQTPSFEMSVSSGVRLARYNLVLLFVSGVWWILEMLRRRFFEAKRWGDLEEDD